MLGSCQKHPEKTLRPIPTPRGAPVTNLTLEVAGRSCEMHVGQWESLMANQGVVHCLYVELEAHLQELSGGLLLAMERRVRACVAPQG